MSVAAGFLYTPGYENPRITPRTRTSTPTRRPTAHRRLLGRRGRRVPRRLTPDGLALARPLPRAWTGGTPGSSRAGQTPQTDHHPGEDRPALVVRQSPGTRVRHRAVKCPAPGPVDPAGVRHPLQSTRAERLAARPRLHTPEARARPAETRPGGDRRVAEDRLATHQKKRGDKAPRSP